MMAKRSPVERLRMASRMFATARALVRAGLGPATPSSGSLRRDMFLRFYGRDFTDREREAILAQFGEGR